MDSKIWGKMAWDTFFIFSRNYPEKINLNNEEHKKIKNSTKKFYSSLKDILPCMYCRESYKRFWKSVPIEPYLTGRDKLTLWLYTIKNLVNKKLIDQQNIEYKQNMEQLVIKDNATKSKIKKLDTIFYTKESPSLQTVINKYEKFRTTVCNSKKCYK